MAAVLFFMDAFTSLPSSDWWRQSQLIPEFSRIIAPFFEHLKQTSSFLSGVV
ncbi:colicin V production protein [Vibrio ishigakensis]|uniref:Colicin V production protein n=1 Tax=Vibrio ishigakensis TaxID=1481914 RepID=A0A0B8QFS1_9VIBR|nr:colicin V production protein [Vibrio ishigakensis]